MMRMMKKPLLSLLFLLLPIPAFTDLRVVATVPALAALAEEIGGNDVSVVSLTRHTQDPHFADARPNLALELNRADVLLLVGLDLEVGWLPVLQTNARNGDILDGGRGWIDCSRFITPLQVQVVDRSMGHLHPQGNPHYLYDPRKIVPIARGVTDRFKQLQPANAESFENRYQDLERAMNQLISRWERRFEPSRGTGIVSFHASFIYLTTWLNWNVEGTLEPKPGLPPSPSHVSSIIRMMNDRSIPLIIQESYYPSNTSELVAGATDARLVVIPSGPDRSRNQSLFDYFESFLVALSREVLD